MSKFLTLSLILLCFCWAEARSYQSFYEYKLQEFSQMKANRLVFLGDSLTMRHNWSSFKASNMGIDGDTTADVLSRLHYTKDAEHIVLMIGVNDILNRIPLREVQANYRRILESLSDDKKKITLLSLLPVIDDRGTQSINQDIRTMNRWIKMQVNKQNITFVDFYPHFLDTQKQGLKKEFTTDGIHLSDKAYQLWEKLLKEAL